MRHLFRVTAALGLILTLAAPALAAPWPMYRDAGGDNWRDWTGIDANSPSDANYKEYDREHPWPRWADQEIKEAISWDLMKGYVDGKDWVGRTMYRFRAEKEITRAEFVTILNRALGYDEDAQAAKSAFPGEAIPDWAAGHVGMLVKKGIVDQGGRFDGARPATRREIAVWLGRAARIEKLPQTDGAYSFPDFQPSDPGYGDAIVAVAAGLMKGYNDGTFRPDATFTRAQSAAVIVRLAKNLPPGDWTMTADQFIQWWQMMTIALKAAYPTPVPDKAILEWFTPEHAMQIRADMENKLPNFGSKYMAVYQARWYPYIDNGAPANTMPGTPQARTVVASRTVMAYDIGYIPGGPVKEGSACWKTEPSAQYRVYIRRFPQGLRISDTRALSDPLFKNNPYPDDVSFWHQPSWWTGWGFWERMPDGTMRRGQNSAGEKTGACAEVQP